MSAKDKVWAVVEERAKEGAKGYALQYVVKESGLTKEEALQELDVLAEQGLIEKSWAYLCPNCGRTQKVFKDGEEPAVVEDPLGCDSCSDGGALYMTRDMAWIQFSASEKLIVPEEVKVEPGVRARKSPLADRQEDRWAS